MQTFALEARPVLLSAAVGNSEKSGSGKVRGWFDSATTIAAADVRDCFYTIQQHEGLVPYFGLRDVTAQEVGISSVSGAPVPPDASITPCFSGMPMGFNWALHLAQCGVRAQVALAGGSEEVEEMLPNRPPP